MEATRAFIASLSAGAVDDGGVVLIDFDLGRPAEHIHGYVLELIAEVGGDYGAAREDGYVFEHRLPSVAEAGCLNRNAVEHALELVHDERCKRVTFDVFCNYEQPCALLRDGFYYRKYFLKGRDLFVGDEDVGVIENCFHLFGVGDHVGGSIASVELHALYGGKFGGH